MIQFVPLSKQFWVRRWVRLKHLRHPVSAPCMRSQSQYLQSLHATPQHSNLPCLMQIFCFGSSWTRFSGGTDWINHDNLSVQRTCAVPCSGLVTLMRHPDSRTGSDSKILSVKTISDREVGWIGTSTNICECHVHVRSQ